MDSDQHYNQLQDKAERGEATQARTSGASASGLNCSGDCGGPCCCFYAFGNPGGGGLNMGGGGGGGDSAGACVVAVVAGAVISAIFGGVFYSASELAYTFSSSPKKGAARASLMAVAGAAAGYGGYVLGEYLASEEPDDTKHKAIVGLTTALAASTGTSLMAGFTRLFLPRGQRLNSEAGPGEAVQPTSQSAQP